MWAFYVSRWDFTNDFLGQVISGKRFWADGSIVAGQKFEYSFDDIGNRRFAGSGGDQSGSNLRYANYTVNNLNQYVERTVPGSLTFSVPETEDLALRSLATF